MQVAQAGPSLVVRVMAAPELPADMSTSPPFREPHQKGGPGTADNGAYGPQPWGPMAITVAVDALEISIWDDERQHLQGRSSMQREIWTEEGLHPAPEELLCLYVEGLEASATQYVHGASNLPTPYRNVAQRHPDVSSMPWLGPSKTSQDLGLHTSYTPSFAVGQALQTCVLDRHKQGTCLATPNEALAP